MLTDQLATLMIEERDKLSRAIEALQPKRRGRPPGSKNSKPEVAASGNSTAPAKIDARHHMRTAAARAAQSKKMRAYWRRIRKSGGKTMAAGA